MEELIIYFADFGLLPALLIIIGIGLLVIEMFMPGFSIPGIIGVLFTLSGIIIQAIASGSVLGGALLTLALLVMLSVAFWLVARSLEKGRLRKSPIVLNTSTDTGSGFTSNADLNAYIGCEGVAVTVLRPAGAAVINGAKLDVVSDSEFIKEGSRIEVSAVEGRRVLVRRVDG